MEVRRPPEVLLVAGDHGHVRHERRRRDPQQPLRARDRRDLVVGADEWAVVLQRWPLHGGLRIVRGV
ncbi:MAG TPA: hypothetical protein VLL48_13500, partial [Longimicrobiales bacterium]|nr:hypothetical protein [Longimicrobiales bacterium]